MQMHKSVAAGESHIPSSAVPPPLAERVMSRVFRRLLLLLFILLVFSFLDRINIGFAGAAMRDDLGLSAAVFGMANTVFYIAYIACGIPANMIMARIGARRWIATLVVAWGITSTCTLFARDAASLYLLRILVGVTEAGFLPGMLYYISCWFPLRYRSRANALFMVAMPVTAMLGAVVSGFLLEMNGLWGLRGWQWLFLVEGMPCLILGAMVWRYLEDRPEEAKWLNVAEKNALLKMLAEDAPLLPAAQGSWFSGRVLHSAIIYFCIVTTLGMVNIWGPQIIAGFSAGSGNIMLGFLAAIPQLITLIAMLWLGWHSDRGHERRWHTALPLVISSTGWLCTAFLHNPVLQLIGLSLASAGAFGAMAVFWALADEGMPVRGRSTGIAFINAFGNAATIVSAVMVGVLRDYTGSFAAGILYAAILLAVGAVMIVGRRDRASGDLSVTH